MQSICYLSLDRCKEAVAAARACVEFDPSFSKAHLIAAKVCFSTIILFCFHDPVLFQAALQWKLPPEERLEQLKAAIGQLQTVQEPFSGEGI